MWKRLIKMDILYIAGGKEEETEQMLRYSLRSIAKYGKNIGKVVVCAPKPLDFNVEQVIVPRRYKEKAKDIMWAIENSIDSLGDEFLYSSVDHFYIKETDFDHYPYYYRGELPTEYGNEKDHYIHHLVDTRHFLEECGLGTIDFSGHCNTHFDKNIFRKYQNAIHKAYDYTPYGIEASAFMINAIDKEKGVEKVYREDIKIACANTYDNIIEKIGKSECFSILFMTMKESVGEWLEIQFPDKCNYE